jgi:hypothetical protein
VSLLVLLPASHPYGLGEAEGEGEAEGAGEAEGEGEGAAVGDGEAVSLVFSTVFSSSVLSGLLEGMGVAVVGSVRSVVRGGGSYGSLSATDSVIPTSAAVSVTTGASATTSGTRTNGRTRPSKKNHNNTAKTTFSTTATSHHGCPNIGVTYLSNIRHEVIPAPKPE